MSEAILAVLETSLRAAPDNGPMAAAYLEAALATAALGRALGLLDELAIAPAALPAPLAARVGRTLRESGRGDVAMAWLTADDPATLMERAWLHLERGEREPGLDCYRRAVTANPAIENKALEAKLSGRVVRLERVVPAGRVTSIANDEVGGADVVRLVQPAQERIGFDQVGGLSEVKTQIRRRIITPFQKPGLFERFRKKSGGGVLLYGPPGCGKTLIARATAGECGAAFLSVAVSDVLDMYIGESERKLHALFEQARRQTPSVLFFDEVEALGGKRQYSRESSSTKVVSQFLAELDGYARNNDGLLVLAATNVPWAVDPAFRRPGRFDRVLFVPPPDLEARREILRGSLERRPREGAIDLDFVARHTSGYSGADLAEVVETAVDEAIEQSIRAGREVPLDDAMLKRALAGTRPTTLEWLTTARNYARYANEGGQYDEVLAFLAAAGKA